MNGHPSHVYTTVIVLDEEQHIQPAQQHGVHMEEVHRQDALGLSSKDCRQVGPDRRGAGSSPTSLRIFHTVDAATVYPSPASYHGYAVNPTTSSPRAISTTNRRIITAVDGRPG